MSGGNASDDVQYGKLSEGLGRTKFEVATSDVRYGALSQELAQVGKTKTEIVAPGEVRYGTLSEELTQVGKMKRDIIASDEVRYGALSQELTQVGKTKTAPDEVRCGTLSEGLSKTKSEIANSDEVQYDELSQELRKNKVKRISCSHALSADERRNKIYQGKNVVQMQIRHVMATLVTVQTCRIIAKYTVAALGKFSKQVSVFCQISVFLLVSIKRQFVDFTQPMTAAETGSVSLPVEGVIIQSARLTQVKLIYK